MHPEARLTILFDCCHSGSACELPFVFRPDAEGNVNMLDTFKKGVGLVRAAGDLLEGGLSMDKVDDAKMLLGGATDFFHSLRYGGGADEEGLTKENFQENWESEGKDVWMFSGCRDDQTSADATIAGAATGAMSWAFMKTMRENPEQSYVNVSRPALGELARLTIDRCFKAREAHWLRTTPRCRNSAAEGVTTSTNRFLCVFLPSHYGGRC
jgi:metacaspase-1